jgi:hypothetical protein
VTAAGDIGGLVILAWLVPFAILAVAAPVLLVIWAILAVVHRL